MGPFQGMLTEVCMPDQDQRVHEGVRCWEGERAPGVVLKIQALDSG